jgi:AcrR family transcriptional regulator
MAVSRRRGDESRELLIQGAEQILNEEGYAAVTARRLAEKLGLKRQIVHYYFGTIEDLLIAVMRRLGEEALRRAGEALTSGEPLRVVWELGHNVSATSYEFLALAARREAIRAEVVRFMVKSRELEAEAVARHLEQRGLACNISPVTLTIVVSSISQALAGERVLGNVLGHEETGALVEHWLRVFAETGQLPVKAPSP